MWKKGCKRGAVENGREKDRKGRHRRVRGEGKKGNKREERIRDVERGKEVVNG
jgi:hypothetical protein